MLPGRYRNLSSSNCWKCIEIVNPNITTLFCIILNLLRSNQADLSDSRPPPPPAYGPEQHKNESFENLEVQFNFLLCLQSTTTKWCTWALTDITTTWCMTTPNTTMWRNLQMAPLLLTKSLALAETAQRS